MRVSREQAEKNHQAVINTASHLFRERGFDGIGLIELMEAAGLTKGGFYKQFASKEDLAAKASQRSMEMAIARWLPLIASKPDAPLQAMIDLYLSPAHCAEKGDGCPLVALGADAARQGREVKDAFEYGVKQHLQILDDIVPIPDEETRAEKASAILALMVGALTLARMVNDKRLSRAFLNSAAKQIREIANS
jgi:TetR/AcrR family transcriptional repressor of nem operon